MAQINGTAKKYDGTAIDYVNMFEWESGKCIETIKPNAFGVWGYLPVVDANVGLTYVADGCEPISHGPYQLSGFMSELFSGGRQGAWFDPSDLSTMFQDAAGTIPVTNSGDPVGLIRDKSGNNHHAKQATSSNRPIYKTNGDLRYLEFNGSSSYLEISNRVLTQPFSLITGYKQSDTGATSAIYGNSASSSDADTWVGLRGLGLYCQQLGNIRDTTAAPFEINSVRLDVGNSGASYIKVNNSTVLPSGDSGIKSDMRIIGALHLLRVGGFYKGRLYSSIMLADVLSAEQELLLTEYTALKSGAIL